MAGGSSAVGGCWCGAVLLLGLVVGCGGGLEGERATGGCPNGETCSPDTPFGLSFTPSMGSFGYGDEPIPIAVGHLQGFCMRDAETDDDLRRPFDVRFRKSVFEVATVEPPCTEIRATKPGKDRMRLVDPETGELFDRLQIRAEHATRVVAGPATLFGISPRPHILLAGSEVLLAVRASSESEPLAAIRPEVSTSAEVLSIEDGLVWLRVPEPPVVTVSASVGAASTTAEMRVVDEVEGVRMTSPDGGAPLTVEAGDSVTPCFEPTVDGALVHGAELEYEARGDIEVSAGLTGCAPVFGARPGRGTLVVVGPGLRHEVPVEVVPRE